MTLDYNKLKTFTIVVEQMSVTKAAKKLYLTQQAVSHQIKNLEEELGVLLLKRADRTIYLTETGKEIYRIAQKNLQKIDNEIQKLNKRQTSLEGTLRLGMVPEIARNLVTPITIAFKKKFPSINIEMITAEDHYTEKEILNGSLNFGFLVFSSESKLLAKKYFLTEEFNTICSKKFWKSHGPFKTLEEIVNLPVIGSHRDTPSFKLWVSKNDIKLAKKIAEKKAEISVPDSDSVIELVKSGIGIAVLPKSLTSKHMGALVEIIPESKKISAKIDIVYFAEKTLSLIEEEFLNFLES